MQPLNLSYILLRVTHFPEKQPREKKIKRYATFYALELTDSHFTKIAQAARLEYCTSENGNYPSPQLKREVIQIVFRESTIGAIRLGTFFNLEGQEEFGLSNPSIFIQRRRAIFKSNDAQSNGLKLIITPKRHRFE